MNPALLNLLGNMVREYEQACGQKPACIKMSPDTMELYLGTEVMTTAFGIPVILNPMFPMGGVFVMDAENLDQEGDLK